MSNLEQLRAQVAALTHLLETHERVLAQQVDRMQGERDRLEAVMLNIPAAAAVLDGPAHVVRFVNQAFLDIVGNRPILGRPASEAFPEVAGQGYLELLDSVYWSGEAYHARESRAVIARDGRETEMFFNYAYIPLRDEHGEMSGVLSFAVDVTDFVRARERERRDAEVLQRSLLPPDLPHAPQLEVASRYIAGGGSLVGGDWYDLFRLPDGRLGCALGDVAGHGARAASVMGQIRMAVRAYAFEGHSPSAVMQRTDRLLQNLGTAEMATLVFAVLDSADRHMVVTSAGHPPPVLRPAGRAAGMLTIEGNPPLGVVDDAEYTEHVFTFEPRDLLLLYSDGLVERRGVSLDDRLTMLVDLVEAVGDRPVDDVCDAVLEKMLDSAEDDVALLALRATAAG